MTLRPIGLAPALLALVLTGSAAAQEMTELPGDIVLPRLNLPVDALDDYDVVIETGEEVGTFAAALGPDEETVQFIAISFDGPGLLFDEDILRLVPFDMIRIEDDNMVIAVSEEGIRDLTVWEEE